MSTSASTPRGPAYEQAVWSWTEHLRAGGTATWADWVSAGSGADATVPSGWTAPGAAQLEYLRRLVATGRMEAAALHEVGDLVLGRSGPGRGLAQQPLSWPGGGGRRFGAPPTDPSGVPAEELVRVGVGTLTELLLRSPGGDAGTTDVRRRLFTRAPAFVLVGAPVTVSAVRRSLAAARQAEGGRSPEVVLFAEPLDQALAQVWSARVQRGAAVRWHAFVGRWAHRVELPPSADLVGLARLWRDRVGAGRVHVVAAEDFDTATRTAADVLGLRAGGLSRRRTRSGSVQPRWKDLSPAATDVARRVNAVLNVRVSADRGRDLTRELSALLAAGTEPPARLTVPRRFRSWTWDEACRQAEAIRADGYPVHGDLDRVVPRFEGVATRPRQEDVLRVVLDACLAQVNTNAHPRRAEQR